MGVVAIVVLFASAWLTLPDRWEHPVLYVLASLLAAYLIGVWLAPWFAMARMQRPLPIEPAARLRVAAVTTFAPHAEPVEMLEQTLMAMVAMDYPHDNWVLDEGDDPRVRALCATLGVHYFTRRGRAEYQAEGGRFASRTKYGNYNAWLAETGFQSYDILAAFDPDHVPERSYLEHTIGYFRDPQVGYVQAPQVYYNQDASFIARGAAEESYTYYSSIQMANYALGEPNVTGSHTVHRMLALRAVGGFPAHDAEDLYLTVLYRRATWRGIYVSEILALGTTPVDWAGYLRQQSRWARAVLDLKIRVYPRLTQGLTLVEQAMGILHGAYYLRPLAMVVVFPMLVYVLVTGARPAFLDPALLPMICTVPAAFFVAHRFRQRFYLDPERERGVHWRAMLLQFAKWPYFVKAAWEAVRGEVGDYEVTMKSASAPARGVVAVPHLLLAAVLGGATAVGFLRHGTPQWELLVIAAGYIVLSLGLACSEILHRPPPFEPGRHGSRRGALFGEPSTVHAVAAATAGVTRRSPAAGATQS